MASDAINRLNKLIETCLDGRNGYRQAADHVKSTHLKTLFDGFSRQRETFTTQLQQVVRQLGGTPTESGSVAANLHRAWIGLKDAITTGDKQIVAECIRGDESAVNQYDEAVRDLSTLPGDAMSIVQRQHGDIRQALATLRQQENTAS